MTRVLMEDLLQPVRAWEVSTKEPAQYKASEKKI